MQSLPMWHLPPTSMTANPSMLVEWPMDRALPDAAARMLTLFQWLCPDDEEPNSADHIVQVAIDSEGEEEGYMETLKMRNQGGLRYPVSK